MTSVEWSQYHLLYMSSFLQLLFHLLQKIEAEGIPVIFMALDWPRHPWYFNVVQLVTDTPWRLPLRKHLLSRGMIIHPAFQSLALVA